VAEIARTLGISRPTVRKYLQGAPPPAVRQRKRRKLDPYQEQIRSWIEQDHGANCVSLLARLRPLGYTGGISQLKAFVHPLRPARAGKRPVIRYETGPGEQLQFDWGEFTYEEGGVKHKLFGFLAILSFSRMRFACFTKRSDAPTLIRCLMAAFEYVGGLPQSVLTDRMKSVLVGAADGVLQWQRDFSDFVASLGVTPHVCKPYTPQTKGKVERTVGVLKSGFWPGVAFTDLDDLNTQVLAWCDRLNERGLPGVEFREAYFSPTFHKFQGELCAGVEVKVTDPRVFDPVATGAAMLIDATRKWDYPPVSLPKKEYMERARQLWERLELPKLKPQDPWFGYNLGLWSDEDEAEAELAVKGEHYQTGEKRLRQRVRVKKG